MKRILIFGGPGVGATTLGRELAARLSLSHFDLRKIFSVREDHYLPVPQDEEEQRNLEVNLSQNPGWILCGPICQWGENLTSLLDLVVFLRLPRRVRLERLKLREIQERGENCLKEGMREFRVFNRFMYSAGQYDQAGPGRDSKILHDIWLSKLQVPILRLEEDAPVQDWVEKVVFKVNNGQLFT
jgi:uridine kinase